MIEKSEEDSGPIPFIKSLSFTGELLIGWSKELQVYEKSEKLPEQKIVLEYNRYKAITEGDDSQQRMLSEEFVDPGFELKSAVDVFVKQMTEDGLKIVEVEWDVKEFTQEELSLQLYFSDDTLESDSEELNV